MKLLYRIFKQDAESRDGIIVMTSGIGIAVNLLIAAVKVLIGTITASIAIVSEGVNNLADALTSILALVGAKLAQKHPDEKHPFGYGRIEYLASLIIAALILVTGIEMLKSSFGLIFDPADLSVSYVSLVIIAFTAVVKYLLGVYTVKMGEKADSGSLKGVGSECKGDAFASLITIISTLIFIIFRISLDAYAGIIISAMIIKAGYEVMKDTVSDLLGRPGEKELADTLYREIRQQEGIIAVADMMLHNYGPDAWSGSVNVEIDHKKTVGEVYEFLHDLQLEIMHKHHVVMVFGIYAIDNDHEQIREIRTNIGSFIKNHEHVKSFHAVYLDSEHNRLYCDFVVDYALKDWAALEKEFSEYMKAIYRDYEVMLTIETEYV